MPYPEEIIAAITAKYELPTSKIEELRKTLFLQGMQEIIEKGFLNLEDLAKQMDARVVVLPSDSARRIVTVYNRIKGLEIFRSGEIKLFPLMKWLTVGEENYIYVPFSDLVEQRVSRLQYAMCCAELQALTVNSLKEIVIWDALKDEVEQLRTMPTSRIREQRRAAKKLRDQLAPLYAFFLSNSLFAGEQLSVSMILSLYANSDEEMMKKAALSYFDKLFQEQHKSIVKMEFFPKTDGVQLGGKIHIEYTDTQGKHEIRFFVKTHQYGSTSSHSSRMSVDSKELLVYKILEYMGFAPKAHFFVDTLSVGACFIATQDVAFTKTPVVKRKEFVLFKSLDEGLSKLLVEGVTIDDETRRGVARIDILARIFRLHDVATNPNNFGRVVINSTRSKWQIVDFRTDTMSVYGFPETIFGGFRDGNGMFRYEGFLCSILKESPEQQRMETARQVLAEFEFGRTKSGHTTERKMSLLDAVNKAFCEIVELLKHNATYLNVSIENVLGKINLDEDPLHQLETLDFMNLGDLGKYVKGVRENFLALNSAVKDSCTVLATEMEDAAKPK